MKSYIYEPQKCPCGGEGCTGVEDGLRHQCGGPQEACMVQGCIECGRAHAMIHAAGVRADNAERREKELIKRLGDLSQVTSEQLAEAFTKGTLAAGDAMREQVEKAFARGVAAMREAVVKSVTCHFPTINAGGNCGLCTFCDAALDEHIRALPAPEDK